MKKQVMSSALLQPKKLDDYTKSVLKKFIESLNLYYNMPKFLSCTFLLFCLVFASVSSYFW